MAGSARHVSRLLHCPRHSLSLPFRIPSPAEDNISHSITLTLRAARHKSFTIKTSPGLHFSFSYAKNTSEPLTKHLKHESGHRELNGMIGGKGAQGQQGRGTGTGGVRRGSWRTAPRHSIIVKQLRDFRVRRCCCCCLLACLPCCDVYFWASHVLARLFFWLNVWPIRAEPRHKAFINSHVSVEKLPTESVFETETEFETFEMFMPQMLLSPFPLLCCLRLG